MGLLWSSSVTIPSSVLIIGSGVFGLSTAYSLCKNPLFDNTSITLVDRQPFPSPDGSSIDTSRIVRPDYASPPYTRLASAAQSLWRTTFAPQHYHENGLCITASGSEEKYVSSSLANVQALGTGKIEVLKNSDDVKRVTGTENASGSAGYINWSSGWVDAEGAMRWLHSKISQLNRVNFLTGTVTKLLINHTTHAVSGAHLQDGRTLTASLTILSAGAWTPSLLDLRGIANATGQVLVYLPITPSEESRLATLPTLLNLSTGLFLIPPSQGLLKIARHGHGYANPTTIPHPESANPSDTITVSLPPHSASHSQSVPQEGESACRAFLSHVYPSLSYTSSSSSRPFTKTRVCWYTDTQTGDFLISYHPKYTGLFVATGGSGHAFKFLPVIGDKIVECVLGNTPEDFRGKWEWPVKRVSEELWEGDGSRGGPIGMVLGEEMAKIESKL
ncbi:sarcosine oxidase [Lindgomyces ingoldianus]|uniref:Sarcosine oxidase n=1 Tax=Lindgomyces ingoldianus TaxID=673940 RepID=A0ACB6QF63_9PLEO|nr:sarcosine oxidase [Lindgomyces ingoldianus]KAF2464752.1 sarcosine oxidase [Lindgomyces ingoldianus]